MTEIAWNNNGPIIRDGQIGIAPGCCCGKCVSCATCSEGCLSITFAGFSSEAECDECNGLNGTYTLTRGSGVKPVLIGGATIGTGATFTVTLTLNNDGSYSISTITVDTPGTCYTDASQFTYTLAGATTACGKEPVVALTAERTEPALDVSISTTGDSGTLGTGGEVTPVYAPQSTTAGAETWKIGSFTVASGGGSYNDCQPLTITTAGCTVAITPASARIRVDASAPTDVRLWRERDSSLVEITDGSAWITWAPVDPLPGFLVTPHWVPTLHATGGAGYATGDLIKISFRDHHFYNTASIGAASDPPGATDLFGLGYVTSVDGSGGIAGFFAYDNTGVGWRWAYQSEGTIESVEILAPGEYYTPGGILSAEVIDSGKFYPSASCTYSYCEQTACSGSPCRKISLTAGGDGFTVLVTVGSTTLLTATKASGEGVACDSLEYSPGEVTSGTCTTVGSITVEPAECGSGPSPTACCGCETCPPLVYLESLDVYAYERDGRYFVINETVSGGWMDDPCGTCDTSTAPWNPPGNPGCSALGGAAWQCYLGRWFAGNTEVSCFRYVAPDTFDCVTGWVGPDSFVVDEWGNLFYGLELATDGLCPSLPVDQTHDILDSYLAPPGGAAGDHVAYCDSIGMPRPTSFSLTVTEVFPFP